MKKTMKRVISLVLSAVIAVTVIPLCVNAESVTSGACGDNAYWNYDNTTRTLTVSGTGATDDFAFSSDGKNSLTPWGEFYMSIDHVVVEEGITYLGNYAFALHRKLKTVSLPESLLSLGKYGFYDCTRLSDINIPGSVTLISDFLFFDCRSLTHVTVPEGVTAVGKSAFSGCGSLTEVNLPSTLTTIEERAFENCRLLPSVVIPDKVNFIGESAFFYCDSLASVTLGKSVSTIRSDAFYRCDMLVEVINRSRLSINAGDPGNGYLVRYAKTVHTGETMLKNVDGFTFFTFDGVNYLMGAAADKKPCLVLPDYYNGEPYEVYKNAFIFDTDIVSVTVGEGVTALGEDSFYGCGGIFEIVNNSQINIRRSDYETYEYWDETGITEYAVSMHSGESLAEQIGDYYFITADGINYLLKYTGEAEELTLPESYNGESYEIFNCAFHKNDDLTSVVIPEGVTAVGYQAFQWCPCLENAVIGDSVTVIGDEAFEGCAQLSELTLGASVTEIGNSAFSSTSVTELVIPDSVKRIGSYAFFDCDGLESVTIGSGVELIEDGAFAYCDNLKSVCFRGSREQWKNVKIEGYNPAFADVEIVFYCEAYGHTWETVTVPATCTEDGLSYEKCAVCSEIKNETVIPAAGHDFENGVCRTCGYNEYGKLQGDVDGDGKLTAADVIAYRRFLSAQPDALDLAEIFEADMNTDGSVNAKDLLLLRRKLGA